MLNSTLQSKLNPNSNINSDDEMDSVTLSWTQKCKDALQTLTEPAVHRIHWPVEGKAIVHSNKLDILLKLRVEVGYGHVFAQDERGSTREYKSYYMCDSLRDFYDFIYSRPADTRHFNEIIFGDWPCKAFFDLDVEKREDESVEAATERVNAMQDSLIACFKEHVETAFDKETHEDPAIYIFVHFSTMLIRPHMPMKLPNLRSTRDTSTTIFNAAITRGGRVGLD